MVLAPSSFILTNYILPLSETLELHMSISYRNTKHRCNFEDLRNNSTLHTLQTDKPIALKNWEEFEKEFLSIRKDVSLRGDGFYDEECDISNIASIPSIRHFSADCLQ